MTAWIAVVPPLVVLAASWTVFFPPRPYRKRKLKQTQSGHWPKIPLERGSSRHQRPEHVREEPLWERSEEDTSESPFRGAPADVDYKKPRWSNSGPLLAWLLGDDR